MNKTTAAIPTHLLGRFIQCAGYFKMRVSMVSIAQSMKGFTTVELTGDAVPKSAICKIDFTMITGVIK